MDDYGWFPTIAAAATLGSILFLIFLVLRTLSPKPKKHIPNQTTDKKKKSKKKGNSRKRDHNQRQQQQHGGPTSSSTSSSEKIIKSFYSSVDKSIPDSINPGDHVDGKAVDENGIDSRADNNI